MAHGLVEATGYSHFRYNPNMDDKELFHAGYNRVYDSLEPETNLDHVEEVMDHISRPGTRKTSLAAGRFTSASASICTRRRPARDFESAYEHKVPIFVPAFSDSELGIDFALHKIARLKDKRPLLRFDPSWISRSLPTRCWLPGAWGFFYDRRRRAAQLVATIWRLRGIAGAARI